MIAVIIIILFFLSFVSFVIAVRQQQRKNEARRIENEYYEMNYKYSMQGMAASNYNEAKYCLDMLENNYPGDKAIGSRNSRQIYHQDMRELREWVKDLDRDRRSDFKDRVHISLEWFAWYYDLVRDPDFETISKINQNKKKCLEWYDNYLELSANDIGIDPIQYLSSYKRLHFDSCMLSREKLVEKLDNMIAASSEMANRKRSLCSQIRSYVKSENGIQRSILLKKEYVGFSEKEINLAYEALLKSRRIKQEKNGNRYYVYIRQS